MDIKRQLKLNQMTNQLQQQARGKTLTELNIEANEKEYYLILKQKLDTIGVSMDGFKTFVDKIKELAYESGRESMREEAIALSDRIESQEEKTEFEEWRAFKQFRNTLRGSALNPKE